jgi:hypothetical protein
VSGEPRENGAVIGAALREAIARANSTRPALTSKEWRAFSAVIARSAAYGRLEDRVTHPVLLELSGLDRSDLRKALRRLDELGVIRYEAGAGRRFSVVGLRRAIPAPLEAARDRQVLPVVEGSSPPSKGGDPALGEEGDPAPLKRNGLPERATERTERVADTTRSRGARAALAAHAPDNDHMRSGRRGRPRGVCSECGVSLAFGRHAVDCPTLEVSTTGAPT